MREGRSVKKGIVRPAIFGPQLDVQDEDVALLLEKLTLVPTPVKEMVVGTTILVQKATAILSSSRACSGVATNELRNEVKFYWKEPGVGLPMAKCFSTFERDMWLIYRYLPAFSDWSNRVVSSGFSIQKS